MDIDADGVRREFGRHGTEADNRTAAQTGCETVFQAGGSSLSKPTRGTRLLLKVLSSQFLIL
jgi:hypothetical protein